jgi:O-antigen/teichoic acid export membrane protein
MNLARRIFRNFFSLTSSYVLTGIIGFLATIYLAKTLGAADFGKISFAYSFLVYFMVLANPGLDRVGIKILARDTRKIGQAGAIVSLRIILAVCAFLILAGIALVLPKDPDVKILIILYGLSLFPYALLLEWVFQGIEKMGIISISRIIDKTVYFVLVLLFIAGVGRTVYIPLFWLAGSLSASLLLLCVFFAKHGTIRLSFAPSAFKKLLLQAIPIGGSYIVIQLFFHFDIIMIGLFRADAEVGVYRAASKIIQLVLPWFNIFFVAIFPIIVRLYTESKEKIKKLFEIILKYLIIICFPIITVGTFTAEYILRFLYGAQYTGGLLVFRILLWTIAFFILSYSFMSLLLAGDRDKRLFVGMVSGTATNIVFNLLLIPFFGMNGAAAATVIGSMVMLGILYAQSVKVVRIPFLKNIPLPFLGFVITAASIYFFEIKNPVLIILIGILGYFCVIFLLRCITIKEIKEIKDQFLGRT